MVKWSKFGNIFNPARQIFPKYDEFVLQITLFWPVYRDLTKVMVKNFWPWPLAHLASINVYVWWSRSAPYPLPLIMKWVQSTCKLMQLDRSYSQMGTAHHRIYNILKKLTISIIVSAIQKEWTATSKEQYQFLIFPLQDTSAPELVTRI